MEEAAAQHAVIPFPTPGAVRVVAKAHAQVSEEHGDTGLVTIPFKLGARRFGTLTLERFRGGSFEPGTIESCQRLLGTLSGPLELQARQERGVLAKLAGGTRDSLASASSRAYRLERPSGLVNTRLEMPPLSRSPLAHPRELRRSCRSLRAPGQLRLP